MYSSALSKGFWKESLQGVRSLRVMCMCALCMALSVILGYFYVPITDGLTIRFTYLATAMASLVAGPIGGLLYGFTVDILDFFMHPGFSFFFGYTLSAMAGAFFYGFFLYRPKITILKLILCRLCVNYIVDVGMGALWSSMLYSKGYIYYVTTSLFKNTVMLPIEVAVMAAFFALVMPALKKSGMVPAQQAGKIGFFK